MKIISPSFIIETEIIQENIFKLVEKIGRTAYKSEDKITSESSEGFVKMLLKRGHWSVFEHISITVRIICDRGVSHEIVRHRLASYTQESTRFCNYAEGKFGKELTVINPVFWDEDSREYRIWWSAMRSAERLYKLLIEFGASPQEARSVLPNSLKTEIVMTMNLREWRHFFELRTSEAAHPQMREIAIPLLNYFKSHISYVFDDLGEDKKKTTTNDTNGTNEEGGKRGCESEKVRGCERADLDLSVPREGERDGTI
jgi:thymidylate synthase (FAD)